MRYPYFLSLFFLLTLLLGSCKKDDTASLPDGFIGHTWLHAYEEDQGDVRVYRPETYAFPPSRGRTGFSCDSDGVFTQLSIAPIDGIGSQKGKWTIFSDNTLLVSFDGQKDVNYKLHIISLKNDVLEVRYLY
ncbi:hypothetical protein [uncultured Hymenobacter sp.]|uniref:hypothetical protein n=1 Tax=uncultured Hymenobacter sp. TaxID=170016 RepID=UPI0035CC335C